MKTDGFKLAVMDTVSGNDWTMCDTGELIAFFAWMDALCMEAQRLHLEPPLPVSDQMTQRLNYWMVDFSCGLTPVQALDAYQSVNRQSAVDAIGTWPDQKYTFIAVRSPPLIPGP